MLEYLLWLVVFASGVALSDIFGLFRQDDTLLVGIGKSLSLGFCYFVAWGIASIFFGLPSLVYLIVESATVAIIFGLLALNDRKRIRFPHSMTKAEKVFIPLVFIPLASILLLHFQKYPLFPQTDSFDFLAHAEYVRTSVLVPFSLPSAILYGGVYSFLDAYTLLSGLPSLFAVRYCMGWMILFSVFILYYACHVIFDSARKTQWKNVALMASVLYAWTGTVWYGMVLDSGLFPNFYGIISSLIAVAAVVEYAENGRHPLLLAFAVANLFFSHYSSVFILPFVLMFLTLSKMGRLRKLEGLSAFALPPVFGVALFPSLPQSFAGFLGGGGGFGVVTPLSQAFSFWPALQYLVAVSNDDFLAVGLLYLLVMYVRSLNIHRRPKETMLLGWFGVSLAVAPLSPIAWRFAFVAVLPLTIMAAKSLCDAIPSAERMNRLSRQKKLARVQTKVGFAVIFFLVLNPAVFIAPIVFLPQTVSASWTAQTFADSLSDQSASADFQRDVYQSMLWMQANLSGARFVSDANFLYKFVPLLTGQGPVADAYYSHVLGWVVPSQVVGFAIREHAQYLIVTSSITVASVPCLDVGNRTKCFTPAQTLTPQSLNTQPVYENRSVRIFKIGAVVG